MHNFIPLSIPNLGGNEWKYVKDCLDTNWVSSVGSYVDRFEREIATFTGAKFAIATVNGTAALHVALQVMDIQPGDYVIVPNLTFIASANAVVYRQATPIFIDVDSDTWQLDVSLLAQFLREKTEYRDGSTVLKQDGRRIRAVMPVHVFGNICDMKALLQLCSQYHLIVVEDATEALGSDYHGTPAGNIGHIGCFSFNGNKIMTTGGGGMIICNDEQVAQRAKHLITQAKADTFAYVHDEIGYNYRLVNILAALGVAQLEQMPDFISRKQAVAAHYHQALQEVGDVTFMQVEPGIQANQWLPTILTGQQAQIFAACQKANIQVRPVWTPMNQLPMFQHHQYIHKNNHAAHIHSRSVSLPCSTSISDQELERVTDVIKSLF